MSRSGYTDDNDNNWSFICWRGAVTSAMRGKRGQAFLRELLDTLDAMPEKRLIQKELQDCNGDVCAIGSVIKNRGLPPGDFPIDDYDSIAEALGINAKIVQEIEWHNDEAHMWVAAPYVGNHSYCAPIPQEKIDSPERRWSLVREWVAGHVK